MWNTLRRWRTWIVNALAALLLVLPDLLTALSGFDWSGLIPARYLPFVTLMVIVLNIWMRSCPAVLPSDEEAGR